MNFDHLDTLKSQLDSHRPLPQAVVNNLHESLVLQWTYHSNAIEGNTLTLKETKVALEGITVGGKTLREHFEAINHKEAILLLETLVQDNAVIYRVKARVCRLRSWGHRHPCFLFRVWM